MAESEKKFQDVLRTLSASYAAQLPEKICHIEDTWAALQKKWDARVLSDFHRMVHSLTGSGATFGFAELSRIARALEAILKVLVNQEDAANSEQGAEIQQHLSALKKASEGTGSAPAGLADLAASMPTADEMQDSKNIILVEDDVELAQELALQLSYFGYSVQIFNRLNDFIRAMKPVRSAVVVMDISFPEDSMGGVNAMIEVQQGRETPIRVVFLSALDDMAARLAAVRSGGLAYFLKPADIGNLVDKLDELTSRVPPQPYRVLIVDDSISLANYYAIVLEQAGMAVKAISNPMVVIGALQEFAPDLILMDVYMPECNGIELARVVRQFEAFVSIPIVYLSAESDMDKQLTAMSMGGDDFLTKPIKPEHLISSVSSRIQRSRLLRSFMVRDSLTGLFNHTTINDHMVREIARAKREKTPLAYAMIDIDHFKRVNDTYGHMVGDHVIKSLSRLLKQRLRDTDVVGRYGGEEFAVIMSNTDAQAAQKVINEIREAFSCLQHLADGIEFSASFSCGIADVALFSTAITLGEAADKALYEAKSAGRNCVMLARG